ncbi:TerD family protein [Streptomyces sp. YS415]|uniref:TerD family protein n=1 Tax=Streptomyces sp. YS415 TaxID=2944806 RepID=UPI002021CCCC|nr:TerD family protein [Streptomyces sp. YS415]MCL7429435.1 TerD family protein [Streptomyces sp. YS415]
MTHITKGANTPVPAGLLRVAVCRRKVGGTPAVEVSALLLDAAGKVRGDADLVFHGRPAHPSGAVRHVGTGDSGEQLAEWLELDLPRVEPAVQRVLIAGSCDDGTFGAVPGLAAQTVAPDGTIVAHYEVTDASSETAFVLGEFYRRDGAWKFRAVGQGYDSGLAGLATDFGIVVAEEPVPVAPVGPTASVGPVMITGVAKTSAPPPTAVVPPPTVAVPPPAAVVVSPPAAVVPVPAPAATAAPWSEGFFDFEPYVRSGKGSSKITMDIPFPPDSGPVIMEARVEDYQWIQVELRGRDDTIFCHDLPEHHGRVLFVPPRKGGPLRLNVSCSGNWKLTVLPLSAARPFDAETVRGSGPEVLFYSGAEADLKVRATDRHNGWFQLNCHRGDTPEELKHPERLVHAWNGKRVKETVRITEGPILLSIDKSRHQWELTTSPVPVPKRGKDGRTDAYEGRGEKTITLVNPRPGRPSLLQYEFTGAERSYDTELKLVDEYGDEDEWLKTYTHGTRGTVVMFSQGQAERTVRVKHSGKWSLRLLPEDEAPLLGRSAEGKGTTVLRYAGPPTLLTVRKTSLGKDEKLCVYAVNHPFGRPVIVLDTHGRRRPSLGPVFVDPGGTCFVSVYATDGTKWRLEPEALGAATGLGPRNQGEGYGVVRHTGAEAEMVVAGSSVIMHVYELDENLFPKRKITGSSGPYRIQSSILHVRALGAWVIELRP